MKVYDGFHPLHYQAVESENGFTFLENFLKGSTQKIYMFPNGYGASIINGGMSHGMDELAVLYHGEKFNLKSRKKRIVKKVAKRLPPGMITYDTGIISDVERYADKDELNRTLNNIANLKG